MQDDLPISAEQLDQVEELDEALKKLEKENPRQARVVELRYFGGAFGGADRRHAADCAAIREA